MYSHLKPDLLLQVVPIHTPTHTGMHVYSKLFVLLSLSLSLLELWLFFLTLLKFALSKSESTTPVHSFVYMLSQTLKLTDNHDNWLPTWLQRCQCKQEFSYATQAEHYFGSSQSKTEYHSLSYQLSVISYLLLLLYLYLQLYMYTCKGDIRVRSRRN